MKLTFLYSKSETPDVASFIFEPEREVTWKAGQYLHYVIPGTDREGQKNDRYFSIASAPSEKHIMLTTRFFEKPSYFKQALKAMKGGDTIEAEEPEGDFVIDDPSKDLIFIAGGIGITPYRSMLIEAAAQGQQLRVNLLYANRNEHIAYRRQLDKLAQKNHTMKISYIIKPRRIDDELLKASLSSIDQPLVYVSGPEPMVEAMVEQLKAAGASEDNIKTDYFPGYEED